MFCDGILRLIEVVCQKYGKVVKRGYVYFMMGFVIRISCFDCEKFVIWLKL